MKDGDKFVIQQRSRLALEDNCIHTIPLISNTYGLNNLTFIFGLDCAPVALTTLEKLCIASPAVIQRRN